MSDNFTLRINPDEFTIGDLEDFEDVTGKSFAEAVRAVPLRDAEGNTVFDEKGRPETVVNLSAKALKALVWIVKRHDDKGFTLDDARNVRVSGLEIDESESDPKGLTD